jgi:hypothetical protein
MLKLGQFLVANTTRCGMIALACALLPWPFSLLAVVLVGFMSLAVSLRPGAYLLAWLFLPAMASTWKAPDDAIAYDIVFLCGVLTFIYAAVIRYFRNWSRLLEAMLVIGLVYEAILHLLPTVWLIQATDFLTKLVLDNLIANLPHEVASIKAMVTALSPYLLGGLYSVFAFLSMWSLMLARVWHLQVTMPTEGRKEFYFMRMPRLLGFVAAILMICQYEWSSAWLVVVTQLFMLPFMFAGMSLYAYGLRAFSQRASTGRWVILALSIVFILLYARYFVLGLAALGFADSLLNFRKLQLVRFKRIKRASS